MTLIIGWTDMARPFAAPPDIPPERAQALRAAFDPTMVDPEFLAHAAKMNISIIPMRGSEIQLVVEEIYRTPPEIVERAATILERIGR